MKILLNGRRGRVGSVLAPGLETAGHELLDAILGGSASSRLFQEIREKRGLAYAVY